jgi:chromate transport protein ChrA
MHKEEVMDITKNVVRKVAPHLPAIIVFATGEFVLSRLGHKRSLATAIAVPIILALVAEFLTQMGERAKSERTEMPTAAVPSGD